MDVLAAQAQHQQQLFGLGANDVVELLSVVLQSGSFGTRVMIHPVNQVTAVRPEASVYPGEFVRAEVNVAQRTIERITKLV